MRPRIHGWKPVLPRADAHLSRRSGCADRAYRAARAAAGRLRKPARTPNTLVFWTLADFDRGRLANAAKDQAAIRSAADDLTAPGEVDLRAVLLGMAALGLGEATDGVRRLEVTADRLDRPAVTPGDPDSRARVEYQTAMAVLIEQWAAGATSDLLSSRRVALARSFIDACDRFPWVLTRAERDKALPLARRIAEGR